MIRGLDRRRTFAATAAFAGSIALALSFSTTGSAQSRLDAPPSTSAALPSALAPGLASLSGELGDLAERSMSSVVSIAVRRQVTAPSAAPIPFGFGFPFPAPRAPAQPEPRFAEGQGSGVVVTDDGLILTNNHVVSNAAEVTVVLPDGSSHAAKVIGTDPATDLAVVRLDDPPDNLVPIAFGDSDAARPGELVMAIGNPFGLSSSATLGMISATGRSRMGITDYEDFIQTDAAINPGNSGGALVNVSGELIGINTAIFSRSGGYQGIGFAIPSNMARRVMDELVESGTVARGWLGVGIAQVPDKVRDALDVEHGGVLLASVEPQSPADQAGLTRGDVVLRLDGADVDDVDAFRYRIAELGPGHRARLDVRRGERTERVTVELGQRPAMLSRR